MDGSNHRDEDLIRRWMVHRLIEVCGGREDEANAAIEAALASSSVHQATEAASDTSDCEVVAQAIAIIFSGRAAHEVAALTSADTGASSGAAVAPDDAPHPSVRLAEGTVLWVWCRGGWIYAIVGRGGHIADEHILRCPDFEGTDDHILSVDLTVVPCMPAFKGPPALLAAEKWLRRSLRTKPAPEPDTDQNPEPDDGDEQGKREGNAQGKRPCPG